MTDYKYSTGADWYRIRILRYPDEPIAKADNVIGWGVKFPSGAVYVEWNNDAFGDHSRLEKRHVSMYGCLDDLKKHTSGTVKRVQ